MSSAAGKLVPQLVFDPSPRSELSGVTVFSNLPISGNRTRMTWRGRRPQPKTLRLPILCGFREILKTAEDRKSQRLSSDSESCHKFKSNMRRMLSLRKFLPRHDELKCLQYRGHGKTLKKTEKTTLR